MSASRDVCEIVGCKHNTPACVFVQQGYTVRGEARAMSEMPRILVDMRAFAEKHGAYPDELEEFDEVIASLTARAVRCEGERGIGNSKVTRFEVIDHRTNSDTFGRALVAWDVAVALSYQDNGRTLKVFLDDPRA